MVAHRGPHCYENTQSIPGNKKSKAPLFGSGLRLNGWRLFRPPGMRAGRPFLVILLTLPTRRVEWDGHMTA